MINDSQRHRGPDDEALWEGRGISLGNTRLAIIETSPAGSQPMQSSDGRYVSVYNGEIYNHAELRQRFHLPSGGSDGAVIPELYARFGTGAFALLRGMFAIIVYDREHGQVILARDPLGIKPLHWRFLGGGGVAASEPGALAALHPTCPPSRPAMAQFLHLGAVPADGAVYDGVAAVPPNTWVKLCQERQVERGAVRSTDPVQPSVVRQPSLREALLASVETHLQSDVPTALLLSSGLDSTAVAWAAAQAGHSVQCLTVSLNPGRDEAAEAGRTARLFGHGHEVVSRPPSADDVDAYFLAMQRPTIDGLNTFLVCSAVRQSGYKVALSGLGGDEAMGGYGHFRALRLLPLLRAAARVPGLLQTAAAATRHNKAQELVEAGRDLDPWHLSVVQRRIWRPGEVAAATNVALPDILPARPHVTTQGGSQALTASEYSLYLQRTLLPDADAFSMAFSVELRVPFVDVDFLAAALAAAPRGPLGKVGAARLLGDARLIDLARKPKQGFSLPLAAWLDHGPLRARLEAARARSAPLWDYVDRERCLPALRPPSAGVTPWAQTWALVVLDGWLRLRLRPANS